MAVRWKRYHPLCKGRREPGDRYGKVIQEGIECEGKRGSYCPEDAPRDCGAWAIEFRDQHGIWKSIIKPGFTKAEAKEAYNEIVRNIQRGLFDLPMLRKMPKVTVEIYSRKYLEHIKGSVPENTFVNRYTAVNAIVRYLGNFEVSKLNIVLIQRFCTDVMQKDNVKPSTVNQYCSILRLILDMAIQEKVIDTNPMQGFKRLKTDESSKRVLTNEEIKVILDESTLSIGWERIAILFGLFTGIRLMDIMTLKWSNIDFNNSMITLIPQKTGRVISLPLSSYLIIELKKYKALVGSEKECLFHVGEINHQTAVRFSKHFIKVFRGLGLSDISFHNLRHTHASRVVEVTKDVSLASGMLGHSNLDTTMTYIHKDLDARKEAVEKFTNHILTLTEYEPGTNVKTA
jgi:integrase